MRWNPYSTGSFNFLKIDQGQSWESISYKTYHNRYPSVEASKDLNKDNIVYANDQVVEGEEDGGEVLLFGAYYFVSNLRTEHSRTVYNILNLLAELGGI